MLEQLHTEPPPVKLVTGRINNTPAHVGDPVFVKIDSAGDQMPAYGPCPWTPHGTTLPTAGALCLVAFDENDLPWIIQWVGGWT